MDFSSRRMDGDANVLGGGEGLKTSAGQPPILIQQQQTPSSSTFASSYGRQMPGGFGGGGPYEDEDVVDGFQFEQTAYDALNLNEYEPIDVSDDTQQTWDRSRSTFHQLPPRGYERSPRFMNGIPQQQQLQQQHPHKVSQSMQQLSSVAVKSQQLHPQQQPQLQQAGTMPRQQAGGSGNSNTFVPTTQPAANSRTSPASWGASLPSSIVERNEYRDAAKFFLEAKGGNEAAAMDFLRGVFLVMTNPNLSPTDPISTETHDWDMAVRNGPPYLTPEDQAAAQAQLVMNQHNSILLQAQRLGVPPRPPPIVPITPLGDEIDQRLATLVILVPGRAHIVGHLIGKGGAEVGRIEREMSVTVKIEAASKMNVQMLERSVCIIGTVAATTLAQQLVSHKVHEKLLSEGVQAEVLKMIVPNEIVRHLIGKNGANINRLQSESGARIQVEPESTMSPGSVGRTIVLQGAERCRSFAQYLILRQIAEDRNVHSEWAGRIPHMHQVGSSSPPSGPSTHGSNPPPPASITGGMAPSATTPGPGQHQAMQQQTKSLHSQQQQQQHYRQQPTTIATVQQHGEEASISYTVPEQSVAYVIGRNGAAIADIQSQTGAKVQISRGGAANVNGDVRKVTITGSTVAVEAAQQLIRQKLQSTNPMGRGGGGFQSPSSYHHQPQMRGSGHPGGIVE